MLLQKIIQELQGVPEEKLTEIYDIIHDFRVSLNQEEAAITTVKEEEPRRPGLLIGELSESFFDPLPEEELQQWE
ncbi:MAG: hypothetical protein ACLFM4_07750 [Phormidium sp.]|jgi:hypothetical protein